MAAAPLAVSTHDYPCTKDRTIPLRSEPEPVNPQTLALAALGWVLACDERAERYLGLTGLDPDTLRAGLGDPAVMASALEFLANHEPDLVRAAEALAVTPEELVAAMDALQA